MALTDTEKNLLNGMCPIAKSVSLGTLVVGGMGISGNPLTSDGLPTEGSWRQFVNSDGDLETQVYASGAWAMKQKIEKS